MTIPLMLKCGLRETAVDRLISGSSMVHDQVVLDTLLQGNSDITCWFHPSIGG